MATGAHIVPVRRGGSAIYVRIPPVIREALAIGRFDYVIVRAVGNEVHLKKLDIEGAVGKLGTSTEKLETPAQISLIKKTA